jgi:prepilin-type N-terminal cleavage/methylation domain-containing protein
MALHFRTNRKGFTLIELLIVIAIILILISIALPNFLEARVRALVTKIKGEMHTLQIALESYRIDYEKKKTFIPGARAGSPKGLSTAYPLPFDYRPSVGLTNTVDDITVRWGLNELTSPIQYLKILPYASFTTLGSREGGNYNARPDAGSAYEPASYFYKVYEVGWRASKEWMLRDTGPDQIFNNAWMTSIAQRPMLYSPTNGTISRGDIILMGP